MHRFPATPLAAALFTILALPAARAQDVSSVAIVALADEAPANGISLTSDFTSGGSQTGGVGGQATDPGGGGVLIQMVPASDTGISNAPVNFQYVRPAGH